MKAFWYSVEGAALALLFSFVGWRVPEAGGIISAVLAAGIFILYLRAPFWAVGAVIAELAFGGKGWWLSAEIFGEPIPVRILIFAAVMSAWAVRVVLSKSNPRTWLSAVPHSLRVPFIGFAIIILWGVAWGLARNNGMASVVLDANAYGYWFLILPLASLVYDDNSNENINTLLVSIAGVGVTLSVVTLLLYHVFDHEYAVAGMLYHWIRDSLLGEVTFIRPGAWRIFLQSQVWLLLVWSWATTLVAAQFFRRRELGSLNALPPAKIGSPSLGEKICIGSTLVLSSSALIISFSRSYWVGWGIAVILFICLSVYQLQIWRRALAVVAISLVGGFLLTVAVQRIPPIPAGFPLKERITLEEAGSSRIAQLKPLLKGIAQHPILGSGFGTTITYKSADPRVVGGTAGGTGEYTTYAFEWGYLDVWLKIGLIGLISLIGLMGSVMVSLWRMIREEAGGQRYTAFTLLIALAALAAVNVFSPYLNHPLGIGFVLVACARCIHPYHQYVKGISPYRHL